jgi:hypothetical protein
MQVANELTCSPLPAHLAMFPSLCSPLDPSVVPIFSSTSHTIVNSWYIIGSSERALVLGRFIQQGVMIRYGPSTAQHRMIGFEQPSKSQIFIFNLRTATCSYHSTPATRCKTHLVSMYSREQILLKGLLS